MTDALLLIVIVAASYLAARLAFDWLAARYMVVSGAEYLLLGILLGPRVSGLLSHDAVESFAPITTLGLGWMGALIGSRFILQVLVRAPARAYRIALAESCLTLSVTTIVMTAALAWQFDMIVSDAIAPGLTLGTLATASTLGAVAVATRGGASRTDLAKTLAISSSMNAFIALLAFTLLLAVVHVTPSSVTRPITPTEWMVIGTGIGVVAGVLFHLFLGEEANPDRLFISLAGGLVAVSGAATYLRLSPMWAAMCFAAVLVNTTRNRKVIINQLERVERPLYFALLIFGGAAWQPSARDWILPVLLYVCVRTVTKIGAARLAARANGAIESLGQDWGRGLLGQGGIAVAIALNYVYQDVLPVPYLVFTAAVASVLMTDLLSARFVRSLLRFDDESPAAASESA